MSHTYVPTTVSFFTDRISNPYAPADVSPAFALPVRAVQRAFDFATLRPTTLPLILVYPPHFAQHHQRGWSIPSQYRMAFTALYTDSTKKDLPLHAGTLEDFINAHTHPHERKELLDLLRQEQKRLTGYRRQHAMDLARRLQP